MKSLAFSIIHASCSLEKWKWWINHLTSSREGEALVTPNSSGYSFPNGFTLGTNRPCSQSPFATPAPGLNNPIAQCLENVFSFSFSMSECDVEGLSKSQCLPAKDQGGCLIFSEGFKATQNIDQTGSYCCTSCRNTVLSVTLRSYIPQLLKEVVAGLTFQLQMIKHIGFNSSPM